MPNRINPFPILVNSTIVHPPPTKGRFQHIAFCFMPQFPFVLLGLGVYLGGYWLLLPALFLVLLVPLMDMITGWQDSGHFQKADFCRSQLFLLHWNTRLYAIFYVAAVLWLAKSLNRFSGAETGFLVFSLSLIGGVCFAAAHELLHAKEKLDQLLQRLTTAFLFYPHYKLIHIQSHHSHASTTHDKNTAWLHESIYSYLLRTVPESMLRCWQIEAARFLNRQSFWARIFHNQMSTYALGQIALLAGLYLWPGWAGLLFYLSQVIGAHLVLESVNYIQHYGLMRKEHEGQYEKTGAEHSWDTYHYFSSYATFRVGHHSYHHIAVKPYYLLSTEAAAPKLPVGYFWAIPMVFIPQWWCRVINPKLEPAAAGVQSAVALQVLR